MSQGNGHHNGYSTTQGGYLGEGGAFPSVPTAPKSYALSGKIMLSAIVILFTVVLLILCLHVYARWYLLRRARLRRRTRQRLVFTAEHQANAAAAATRGLDTEVINSLPVFTYSALKYAAETDESMECAVCLSEFQENDKGRRLPRCKHSFHIECIDMWFYSHASCPLCRSTVEPESPLVVSDQSVCIQIDAPAPPELSDSSRYEDDGATAATAGSTSSFPSSSSGSSCSSSNSPGCGTLSRIQVPPRRGAEGLRSLEEEVVSPGVAQGFKSPISRMASLKRILSFDLRFYRGGCSNESDLERGGPADAAEEQTHCLSAPQQQQQR